MSRLRDDLPEPPELSANEPDLRYSLGRRQFLRRAGEALAVAGITRLAGAQQAASKPNQQDDVQLPQIKDAATETAEKAPGPFESQDQRIGFAVVGLGHLAIDQILPAFGRSKYCKPVALVSGYDGNLDKAHKLAMQYGVRTSAIYDYGRYDELEKNPEVKIIYVVLPNSLHAEYTIRGARAGKHILCEKPMATSATDCERMISACKSAGVKLMIAYRQQYEPMNRAIVKMVREGKLGKLRSFVATNTQNQGDPNQWRLHPSLSGGGCLVDVGIYCINAARFVSGEEPVEVLGASFQPKDDPRFHGVEAACTFMLRFPSGFLASCSSGFAAHHSQAFRLEGSDAWAELNPAFGYTGLKMRSSRLVDGQEVVMEPSIEQGDQFATEMDHMALCVMNDVEPHTPGEEGLQDQRLIEAIYESARTGQVVRVQPPPAHTRGPEPLEESGS